MDGFGLAAMFILLWAWSSPEGVGKWLAVARNAFDIERRKDNR